MRSIHTARYFHINVAGRPRLETCAQVDRQYRRALTFSDRPGQHPLPFMRRDQLGRLIFGRKIEPVRLEPRPEPVVSPRFVSSL